jgi:hypothetical protein
MMLYIAEYKSRVVALHRVSSSLSGANYPVYNPSDYWKISIYLVFLDHLVEEISKRAESNEERFFRVFGRFLLLFFVGGASYNNPASLLNLTPEIDDRRFNAYQRDLPKKVHFVDVVERWKIRFVADDTDIVSKIQMMLYIAEYKSRVVALHRVSSSLSGLSSTKAQLIFQRSTTSTKCTFFGKSL